MIDALVHWLHLMAAISWVGGMIATSFVVQPALRAGLAPGPRMALYRDIGARLRRVQMTALAVLAGTGLFKLRGMLENPESFLSLYGLILGVKLTLVAGMLVLSFLHTVVWGPRLAGLAESPQSPEFFSAAARLNFWGKVSVLLAASVVFLAAALRIGTF